jgi:hypothetical protein
MVQMEVELPKSATIRDLKKLVGERMGVNPAKVSIQFLKSHLTIVTFRRNILKKVLQASYR